MTPFTNPNSMPAPIIPVSTVIPPIAPAATPPTGATAAGKEFQSVFTDAVAKVESFQRNAQQSVDRFLSGEGEEIHSVALATEQASLSFDLFLQMRNKVVSAYQEVMRMQV
jgi:flagellar hook-basal body complex protein FliE